MLSLDRGGRNTAARKRSTAGRNPAGSDRTSVAHRRRHRRSTKGAPPAGRAPHLLQFQPGSPPTSAAPLRCLRLPALGRRRHVPRHPALPRLDRLAAFVARQLANHHLPGGAEFREQLAHRRQGHAHLGGDLEVEPLTVLLQAEPKKALRFFVRDARAALHPAVTAAKCAASNRLLSAPMLKCRLLSTQSAPNVNAR